MASRSAGDSQRISCSGIPDCSMEFRHIESDLDSPHRNGIDHGVQRPGSCQGQALQLAGVEAKCKDGERTPEDKESFSCP
eukprot:989094-Amorphochlora_amoeboformis.AAC.2